MRNFFIGAGRAVGVVALTSFLSFTAENIVGAGFLPVTIATMISALALGIEHGIEQSSGRALFGAVKSY